VIGAAALELVLLSLSQLLGNRTSADGNHLYVCIIAFFVVFLYPDIMFVCWPEYL
jgi:hypothetical protein